MRHSVEFAEAAARNVDEARKLLNRADACLRTPRAGSALADVVTFDERVSRGRLAAPDLPTAVSLGGIRDVTFRDETPEQVREAIRAYANWMLEVAEKCH